MRNISFLAVISSTLAPIALAAGWLIAQASWPEFDPVVKTISDLAADDAPTQLWMSSVFVFVGTMHLITGLFARALAWPGRLVIILAGLGTYALTYFSTPSQDGYSWNHRYAAIATFVLMSAWPLFSMRVRGNFAWLLRPIGAIAATAVLTALSLWFLSVWTNPDANFVGTAERAGAFLQPAYLAFVVWVSYLRARQGAIRE
jgi:hypothetical membrane protein